MTSIHLDLKDRGYDITVGSGILSDAGKYFNLKRKVLIVTDDGVPETYAETVAKAANEAKIYVVPAGEGSKSLATMEKVLTAMLEFGMTRADAVVAVGGGVVGDLAGFCAATYMRGIDFYNAPTTTLSQVDSSIGGKCAVNLASTKNTVGAFYQPRAVLIDTETLKTLSERHFHAGLAESVKMALTSDAELFEIFEKDGVTENNLEKSLLIKKSVVEQDEKESGLRKILNFGHTFGHGVEAAEGLGELYHGECVSIGMIPTSAKEVRERLIPVLKKLDLPTAFTGDVDAALAFAAHDKKASSSGIDVVLVDKVGTFRIEKMTFDAFSTFIKERL